MIYDLQKASIWKRISAFLFDVILLSIVVVGSAFLLSLITDYDSKNQRYRGAVEAIEKKYDDLNFNISRTDYEALPEETKARYDEAYRELNDDEEAVYYFNLTINLSLVIITVSFLIGYLILEFALPMIFKNGQTLGKKIFGIAVMRTNGVRVTGPVVFIRTVLGKFAVETMIAVYIAIMFWFGKADVLMIILFFLIPTVSIITMIATKTNSPIHDLLAATVTVDLSSQMIFDSEEDMIEYKKKAHALQTEREREYKLSDDNPKKTENNTKQE